MHYDFPSGLILQPEKYRNGLTPELGLTEHDRDEVRSFYPPIDDRHLPKLSPFRLERLELEAGGQANFVIEPTETRDYTVQTFGDDDSGTSRNARITERLFPGRRYILRLRLYLNWASGETAIMLW